MVNRFTDTTAREAGKHYYGLFNDSFPPILDGVALAVENYARWLAEAGREPLVVTPSNPVRVERIYPVMRFFSVPIINRPPYRYGYPRADFAIWRKLRNTPFRIVHAHCPFASGRLALYAARKQRIPLIATFHSKYRSDLEHSFRSMPWATKIIMKRILSFFNSCDEVWIPQAQVEETVREYGYRGPLTVVENGNDFADIAGYDLFGYKAAARREHGRSDDELALIFVGQHIVEKGILTIVDALALLKDKLNFRMDFIGSGYASERLRKRIAECGLEKRVTLHGPVACRETLGKLYAAADIFVFPSYYDNAPLVVREAAAFGTPPILAEGSTASEVLTDGVNGFTTAVDARELAELILRIDSDRDLLRKAALNARASLVRSWENVVEEVAGRYDEAIARYRRNNKYSAR